MNHTGSKNPILKGRDILFECAQCLKSLVIDCRGAGLNIQCPQCGSELEVPIPEGFDLAELDKEISDSVASDAEVKTPMPDPHPGRALSSIVDEEVDTLQAQRKTLRARQQNLAQQHADLLKTVRTVSSQTEEFRRALDEFARMLSALTEPKANETQKPA